MKLFSIIFLFIPFFVNGQSDNFEQLRKDKNYTKILQIVNKDIKNSVDSGKTYYHKAWSEHGMKLYSSSIKTATDGMNKLEESDSVYMQLLFLRGLSYALSGDFKSAIGDGEALVEAKPKNISYIFNLTYYYGENKQYYNCIKTLKKGLKVDSTHVGMLNNLSYYNSEVEDYNASIYYAERGLNLAKDSVWIGSLLNNLGYSIGKSKNVDKGIEKILESLKYNPSNSFAYYYLGLFSLEKKDNDLACRYFSKSYSLGGVNMSSPYINQYCLDN